jgi:hypothetical protein
MSAQSGAGNRTPARCFDFKIPVEDIPAVHHAPHPIASSMCLLLFIRNKLTGGTLGIKIFLGSNIFGCGESNPS